MRPAGWSLGALVVAIAVGFAADVLFVDVLDAAADPLTGGAVIPEWIQIVVTAILVGGAIGGVVGSRIERHAVAIAAGVTLVYLAVWPFGVVLERGVVVLVGGALHVAAATFVARWTASRR